MATINKALTSYARGLSAEYAKRNSLADWLAPVVETGASYGNYIEWSDKNSMQAINAARAIGGKRRRLTVEGTNAVFNCQPRGLEVPLDAAEGDLVADMELLRQAKLSSLIGTAIRSRENDVLTAIKAGLSATGSIGVWSSASNDPIAEIDGVIETIGNAIGAMPNRIVFGLSAWRVFRNHAKVTARFSGVSAGISAEQAGGLFMNPGMELRIGTLSKDTAKFGAAKSAANIVGGEVFIFFGEEIPTKDDMSFAKTFRVRADAVTAVREYQDDEANSTILAVDWSEQVKVTNAAAGGRITLS